MTLLERLKRIGAFILALETKAPLGVVIINTPPLTGIGVTHVVCNGVTPLWCIESKRIADKILTEDVARTGEIGNPLWNTNDPPDDYEVFELYSFEREYAGK